MMDLSGHEREIPIPIQIQIPISTKYIGDHGGHGNKIIPESLHHPSSNGPPPPVPPSNITIPDDNHQNNNSNKKSLAVKYRECLKNHAASIGGNATDGCGEFMPSGEEGTVEALKCSACNCHRNFHRKEVEGESSIELYNYNHHNHHHKGRKVVGQKGVLISGSDPFGYTAHNSQLIPMPSPHHMIMPFGAIQTSESDEMEGCGGIMSRQQPIMMKKRFRTKFTPEQKEKMLSFAERVGWRLQKQEDGVVQQFCQEIGVKRRVLKVWMHNNKHSLAKKGSFQLDNSG